MKKISKLLYVLAALPLLVNSCVEEVVRTKGDPDLEDCYGVYFKELSRQEANLELDPKAKTEVTLTALRPNSEDIADLPAITVPVEVDCPELESGAPVFNLSEITFEEGQVETQFTVSFPDAELGTTYKCAIEITDPQYASVYSQNPNVVTFSVTRVKWVRLKGENGETEGTYREGIISDIYGMPHAVAPIKIYERQDKAGYYKIENLYSAELMAGLLGTTPEEIEQAGILTPSKVFLDCTDPKKVVWVHSPIGVDLAAAGADIKGALGVGSFCDRYLDIPASESLYGTLKDGIIRFPKKGLFLSSPDNIYYGNINGFVRFVLPGFRDVDFSLETASGLSKEGVLPVLVKKGEDVTSVKYAVAEGEIKNRAVVSFAKKIASGEVAGTDVTFTKEPIAQIGVQLDKSGIYTVVFAGLDADGKTLVASAGEVIAYVAAGDSKPVLGNVGLIVSDKYAPEGMTAENSMEIYISGKNIVAGQMGLYKKSVVDSDPEGVAKDLQSQVLSPEVIKAINAGGWSAVVDKLQAGTEYTLLCNLSNGYEEKLFTAVARTAGEADPLQNIYSLDQLAPAKAKADYLKTWALYQFGEGSRINTGNVTLTDGGQQDGVEGKPVEVVKMNGLWTPVLKPAGATMANDVTLWEYNDGVLFQLPSYYGAFSFKGQNLFGALVAELSSQQVAFANAYVGAFTPEGNIAFVDSGVYAEAGYGNVLNMALYLFSDDTYKKPTAKFTTTSDILLVSPDNVPAEAGAKAAPTYELLRNVQRNFNNGFNGVEPLRVQMIKAIHKADLQRVCAQGRLTDIHPEREGIPVEHQATQISEFEIRAEKCNVTLK